MLKERLITVAVVLPLLLALLFYAPGPLWGGVIGAAVLLAALEWARLCGMSRVAAFLFAAIAVVSAAPLILADVMPVWRSFAVPALQLLCAAAVLFWVVIVPCWLYFGWTVRNRALLALTGWIVLVPAWLAIHALQKMPLVLLLALCVVWIADTAAYFAGRRFGRHKLAPAISPGKTLEGLAGAYAAVLLYALLVVVLLMPQAGLPEKGSMVLFAVVLATLSVAGDLFESWIKRQAGAKDSGALLPGHGGVLDRIDSLTATMPFAALYLLSPGT
jgi:phosphatidate cytidylyltransferase